MIGSFFFKGDSLIETKYELGIKEDSNVYEVIRIIGGVPLFLREHLIRLKHSYKLKYNRDIIIDEKYIEDKIKLLSLKNNEENINTKIIIDNKENIYIFFINSIYLNLEAYHIGVDTITYNDERKSPNIKEYDKELREDINKKIKEKNVYEAILIDRENLITEGSRSNIFLVKGQCIYTSKNDKVLKGITRDKVFEICKENNLKIIEKNINIKELKNMDAIFLTGTSPKILPIKKVDDIKFNSSNNILVKKIIFLYDELIEKNIK